MKFKTRHKQKSTGPEKRKTENEKQHMRQNIP